MSRSRRSTKELSGLAELGALASAEEVKPLLMMVSEKEAGHSSRRKGAKVCNFCLAYMDQFFLTQFALNESLTVIPDLGKFEIQCIYDTLYILFMVNDFVWLKLTLKAIDYTFTHQNTFS